MNLGNTQSLTKIYESPIEMWLCMIYSLRGLTFSLLLFFSILFLSGCINPLYSSEFVDETIRFSEATDGVDVIIFVEHMDILAIIIQKFPVNNSKLESNVIIDNATIDRYHDMYTTASSDPKNYRLVFSYYALSVLFTDISFNYSYLQSIWNSYPELNHSSFLAPDSIKDFQYLSSPLEDPPISITSGWIIMQSLWYKRISGPLNGNFYFLAQVVILDSEGNLMWLSSDSAFAIS